MPWLEVSVMELRGEFVGLALAAGANVSDLCRRFGIERSTGHKWLKRYREGGYPALEELSRRPASSPSMTGHEVVQAVLALRARHPSWGAKKLSLVLKRTLGADGPAEGTVARLLKSAGATRRRRPPVRVWHVEGRPCVEAKEPNDLWTIDFKGWWRAKNGERCEPLTLRDAMSRMVLAVTVLTSTRGALVRQLLEKLFARHGTPRAMLMDNGSPWVSTRSRAGLTRLSVWLVSLGIRLHRSRPASPQDNGGHERMHRDLEELRLTPGRSRKAQQPLCDRWMLDFNHVRPHEALGNKTPAEVYGRPERRRPVAQIPIYPAGHIARRVLSSGEITLNGDRVSIGRAFPGQLIGLLYEGGLRWRAFLFDIDLGTIEFAGHDLLDTELAASATTAVNLNEGTQTATPVSA